MHSRLVIFFHALVVLGAASGSEALHAREIRISASDLLAAFIAEPLETLGEANGLELEIDSIGSLPAMDRLESDEIDLAVIAVPENDEVPREGHRVFPFAYDVTIVAVNETHPLDEISLARLGGIFGADEELNFTSWGDLGLSGWGNRSIKPLAGLNEASISLELFKNEVLRSKTFKPAVAMVRDTEVEGLLASDAASIAILPHLPTNDALKTLMVSEGEDTPAFGPTEDNIHFGDYPVRLSFYIVFNPRDDDLVKDVLRGLYSEEVAEALRANHLFPLPDTVRRKLLIDLDLER